MDATSKLIASFYFSAIYYGAAVWMIPELKAKDWKLQEATHYKTLRISMCDCDYKRTISRSGSELSKRNSTTMVVSCLTS